LLLLLALAVAGQGVRYLVTRPGESPGDVQLLRALGTGSPAQQRDSAMRQGRPLAEGERIDVDVAAAGELARLPKVGPRLAKTIVADRQAHGPFGGLGGLDRVAGVGPGLLKTLTPHVVFSGSGAPKNAATAQKMLDINTATVAELDGLPGIGPAKAQAIVRYREEHGPFIDVEALAGVPGLSRTIGTRLSRLVVAR